MAREYKDKRWIRKRSIILKRDNYLCQECKRYGKATPATTVHHIKPLDLYPELWLDNRNLYSCCDSCHNTFHNRDTRELTDKGVRLVERIYKHEAPLVI